MHFVYNIGLEVHKKESIMSTNNAESILANEGEMLPARVQTELVDLAEKHNLDTLVLFGSRARGDHHRTSDIDLALHGGNTKRFALDADEETHTLLRFDCVDLDASMRPDLRASIEHEGVVLYAKAH